MRRRPPDLIVWLVVPFLLLGIVSLAVTCFLVMVAYWTWRGARALWQLLHAPGAPVSPARPGRALGDRPGFREHGGWRL